MKTRMLCMLVLACFGASVTASTGPYTPDAQTLLLYHMDEQVGPDVLDATAGGRDGAMTAHLAAQAGNRVAGAAGFGGALHWDLAVSEYKGVVWEGEDLGLGDLPGFTVDCMLKPTSFTGHDYYFALNVASSGLGSCIGVRVPHDLPGTQSEINQLDIYTYSGAHLTERVDLSEPLVAGEWQQLRVVYTEIGADDSRYEVYKNGSLIGTSDQAYQIKNGATHLTLGQYPGGVWYRQYEGSMDEFRILNYAIPEPATMALLVSGGLLALRRRK